MDEELFIRCSESVRDKYLSFPSLPRRYQVVFDEGDEYIALDFETTGLEASTDRLIEVGAVRVSGQEVTGRYQSLVNPEVPIPYPVQSITGITDEMVEGAPGADQVFADLADFIGESPVVAYSRLEEEFLRFHYPRMGHGQFHNKYIDALDLSIMLLPSLRWHRQVDLAGIWGVETGREHRAGDDAQTLARLFTYLLNGLYNLPPPILKALSDHADPKGGGLAWLFRRVFREVSGGRRVEPLNLEQTVLRDGFWEGVPPLEGTTEPRPVSPAEVRSVFDLEGPLARQFSDYEGRDEQLHMAEAVRKAFENDEILLVEAGTGTGKSLAYLVPAVISAGARQLPVVVSTRTLNLQDQLFTKDLPLLEAALGGGFRYSVMKGYGNYICLRKLQGLINSRSRLPERQLGILGMIINWVGENDTGDFSMLNVPYTRGVEQMVLANHRECPGGRCAFARSGDCFYRKALHRAKRSHIVVVNHSLLLTGVGIPFRSAVIDEAHILEEVATEQFSLNLEYRDSKRFLDSLYLPLEGGGFIPDLAETLGEHLDPAALDAARFLLNESAEAVELCLEDLERLFVALAEFYDGNEYGFTDIRFSGARMEQPEYAGLKRAAQDLCASLDRLVLRLSRARAVVAERGDGSSQLEYALADLGGKIARAEEMKSTLEIVLGEEEDGRVRWATAASAEGFEQQSLKASPVDVGPCLSDMLYSTLDAVVLTSATLTVRGSFDFFRSRVGLNLIRERSVEALMLESSFDYKSQMQILLLHDMPDPNSAGFTDGIADVLIRAIEAAGGGALVLFTNRKLMLDTYELVAGELRSRGLNVLCQQPGYSRRRLAEEFVEEDTASLFGTMSFWEGVDARGSTLRLVVVTRIPFESPGRPVFEARSEKVVNDGGNDFFDLSLPLAALRLKQGVGRLIRTRRDRGQVLIMDSRINHKQYGQVLLKSLPGGRRRRVSMDEVARAVADFQKGR